MYDSMGRWGERGTAEQSQCAEGSAEDRACDLSRGTPAHGTRACASRTLSHRFFVVCVCDTHCEKLRVRILSLSAPLSLSLAARFFCRNPTHRVRVQTRNFLVIGTAP